MLPQAKRLLYDGIARLPHVFPLMCAQIIEIQLELRQRSVH